MGDDKKPTEEIDDKTFTLLYDQLRDQSTKMSQMFDMVEQLKNVNLNKTIDCNNTTNKFTSNINKLLQFIKSVQIQNESLIDEVQKIKLVLGDHDKQLFILGNGYDRLVKDKNTDEANIKTLSKKVEKQEPFRLTILAIVAVITSLVIAMTHLEKIYNFFHRIFIP